MKQLKYYISGLAFVVIAVLSFALYTHTAKANPLYVAPTVQTAAATTTVIYMTPGNATSSTLVYDSYKNPSGTAVVPDRATLLVQFAGSSTASQLNINLEYAQDTSGTDCVATPTACDWYADNLYVNGLSTTTQANAQFVKPGIQYAWVFASSTIGGVPAAATALGTSSKAFSISVPTRYVRAVFSLGIVTNGNGAVWAQIVPVKQKPQI